MVMALHVLVRGDSLPDAEWHPQGSTLIPPVSDEIRKSPMFSPETKGPNHKIPSGLRATGFVAIVAVLLVMSQPVHGQDGSLLTSLENEIARSAQGWETRILEVARSLFWILATIEVGIAAVWLALAAASLDAWFSELVRRIIFIGLFVFILEQGPTFGRAVVDSLFQIGSGGGSASPANIFNAGLSVAGQLSGQAQFGLFEDNALAIAAVFAMIMVIVSFSLVAAIFVAVMVEMYVGLLAGMIMLGLGGSSYTKDFAVRYLVYAFSVGMKLMALVMIARIGSEVLVGLAGSEGQDDTFLTTLAIGGLSIVIFVIAIYVPNILQGLVQGASVTGGMEVIRHGGQAGQLASGAVALAWGGARAAGAAYSSTRDAGGSSGAAALRGLATGLSAPSGAMAGAARDKAVGAPGTWGASTLGLANAKLDESIERQKSHPAGMKGGK